jgi:tRNA(Ile)-lysidine synthase
MAAADPFPRTRTTGAVERRVARALTSAIGDGERVVVAVSGGPDSVATLVATSRALGTNRVLAAHFDHRLRSREETAGDLEAVRALADVLGVELLAGRAARVPQDRGEEAAREARYRWLARQCAQHRVRACVTGHTLDDQAETVLLRLVRGAGAGGSAGMTEAAPWPVPGRGTRALRLIRPLLAITRTDVEQYLGALGIEAQTDPSNAEPGYARNRIRRRVMPELRALNPRAAEHLAHFAELQRADDEALETWARAEFERIARVSQRRVEIDRRELGALPLAIAARCVRRAAGHLGVRLDAAQVEALLRAAGRRGQSVALGGARASTDGQLLVVEAVRETGGESGICTDA